MKWSAHVQYKRFLSANVATLSPGFYLYLLFLLILFGPWDNSASWIAYLVGFVLIVVPIYCLAMYMLLRRMRRLAGSTVMEYEITDDVLQVRVGRDMMSFPVDQMRIKRVGGYYMKLSRTKTWFGSVLLFFDGAETLERAKALLSTTEPTK